MTKGINQKDLITDSDLLKMSVLLYFNGNKLESVERINDSKVKFGVLRDENTDNILEQFYKGSLRVEPTKIFIIQKELKRKTFSI
ncbi:MAG: hypothetical protein GF347_01785 [Candidatus Moranbacteria bacterium]|nr:hypothetical protein [Candidatus Moranbacteria bacterium]